MLKSLKSALSDSRFLLAGFYGFAAAYPAACALIVHARVPYIPLCPFYLSTGVECPFCGLSRSIGHLLLGDFQQSWQRSKLALPFLLFLVISGFVLTKKFANPKS